MVSRARIHRYNVLDMVAKYSLEKEEVKVQFSLYLIFNSFLHIQKTQKPEEREKKHSNTKSHF